MSYRVKPEAGVSDFILDEVVCVTPGGQIKEYAVECISLRSSGMCFRYAGTAEAHC